MLKNNYKRLILKRSSTTTILFSLRTCPLLFVRVVDAMIRLPQSLFCGL